MRIFDSGLLLLVVFACGACAEPAAKNPVALIPLGSVDAALVQRAKDWAESNLAVPVPVREGRSEPVASLDEALAWGRTQLKPEDVGLVVLAWPSEDIKNHGVFNGPERLAVVNVRAMKTEDVADETYARRVERQVMRGIGMLVGLDASPNPQSAMTTYSSMEELDQIGRNYDPPWLIKFQDRARDLGIPVDTNSPFYMGN
jgi:hypothetical protein